MAYQMSDTIAFEGTGNGRREELGMITDIGEGSSLTVRILSLSTETGKHILTEGIPIVVLSHRVKVVQKAALLRHILVLMSRYLTKGEVRWYNGMSDVFMVIEEDPSFIFPIFEKLERGVFRIQPPSAVLDLHLAKCALVVAIHSALSHSGGKSTVIVNAHVESRLANMFCLFYPPETNVTISSEIFFRPTGLVLHRATQLTRKSFAERGIEIYSLLPLSVFQSMLCRDVTWVRTPHLSCLL